MDKEGLRSQHPSESCAFTGSIGWKKLDGCCTLEILRAIEAMFIKKLKSVLNKRDKLFRQELTLKRLIKQKY